MRKIVFIGATILATTFSSFAANDLVQNEIPAIEIADTCTTVASLAYNLAISEGADHPTAVQFSNIAYNNCKKTDK